MADTQMALPVSETIMVRGQPYTRHFYDWYIDAALELAPADWTYEDVVRLRYAIRENHNHGHFISIHHLAGDGDGLKVFVEMIELLEACHYA